MYHTGKNEQITYTRMRAPFVNKDGFFFEISREGLFAPVGKLFGMQDIKIGDPDFDKMFIIKSNSEDKIRLLLDDRRIKSFISNHPEIRFRIFDDQGVFRQHFPRGVYELHLDKKGVVKDIDLLKEMFDLFTLTLERLVRIDSAYEDDPNITL